MKISVLLFSFAGTAAAFWLLLFVSDARASPAPMSNAAPISTFPSLKP